LLLDSLERTMPQYLIMVSQDPRSKGALSVDTAMLAVKRFYVCTQTAIPSEIVDILNSVEIPADACGTEQ
ncbi:MAG TPA: hypothetical protein VNA17_01310, partial [Pyrinomonadaceae bacterium]|nr:hypothetical protein [Pyrinomonadaceae bacterium]